MTQAPDAPQVSFEVERKYAVGDTTVIPGAEAFATVGFVPEAGEMQRMVAEYFDTPTLQLAAQRVALRRRSGGADAGWHLKVREVGGVREHHWPLTDELPEAVHEAVVDRIGVEAAASLVCIARLHTERRIVRLRDASERELVELADDRVEAINLLSGVSQTWREWEAELMPSAPERVLDAVEPVLVAAGASRSEGTSKIQRTMRGE